MKHKKFIVRFIHPIFWCPSSASNRSRTSGWPRSIHCKRLRFSYFHLSAYYQHVLILIHL